MKQLMLQRSFATLLTLLLSTSLFAQKTINIDSSLRTNSTQTPVKRKGAGAIGKYEFGPYKIVSGKGGATTTRSKTGLLSNDSETRSNSNKSFVFVGDEKDTVMVHASENTSVRVEEKNGFIFSQFFNWNDQEVVEGMEKFTVNFSKTTESKIWNMVIVYPVPVQIDGHLATDQKTFYKGMLTDGSTEIEIKMLDRWSEGKTTILNPALGYEFCIDSRSVAAVQVMPINKMYAWLDKDLDEETKLALATAIASLLVRTF